jgi:hypothetical protein
MVLAIFQPRRRLLLQVILQLNVGSIPQWLHNVLSYV